MKHDIKLALGKYFFSRKKKNTRKMIKGYREMARINTELAQLSLTADWEAWCGYENELSECEERDSKKGGHLLR